MSKRRLQGLSILLLLGIAALALPAVRAIVVQFSLRRLHPSLSAQDVQLHADAKVVELARFRWGRDVGQKRYELRADRLWLAVDHQPLAACRLDIPMARMEGVTLTLDEQSGRGKTQPFETFWHQEIAGRVARLDWEDIQHHFGSLLTADQIHESWQGRIERWVTRSREIYAEVASIETEVNAADASPQNPLRDADALRRKWEQVSRLTQEQQLLISQFGGIQNLLNAECNRLKSTFDEDVAQLTDLAVALEGAEIDPRSISESLMLELAKHAWHLTADCAELPARAAADFPWREQPAYDREILPCGKDSARFRLRDLRGSGHFVSAAGRLPVVFSASVSRNSPASDPAQDGPTDGSDPESARWHYGYQSPLGRIAVTASCSREIAEGISIDLRLEPLSAQADISPSDRLVADIDRPVQTRDARLHFQITSTKQGISGAMFLRDPGDWLDLKSELETPISLSEKLEYEVQVGGTWSTPSFRLVPDPPGWLIAAVESRLSSRLREQTSTWEAELAQRFQNQLDQLQSLVALAAREAQASIEVHERRGLALRDSLQHRLDEISGTAFIRSHQPTIR